MPGPQLPQEPPAEDLAALCEALGLSGVPASLSLALTHRSYAYENGGLPTNERLEFLGDAVLGVHVTEYLYLTYPDLPEGRLAKLRSAVVNMRALAVLARNLGADGIGPLIRLGRGEIVTGGADKDSILADAFEAILGAVHLDMGPDVARGLVLRLLVPEIEAALSNGSGLDWKTHLQEYSAMNDLGVPGYRIEQDGPDHDKTFKAVVVLQGREYGSGSGRTKKEAEQQAARRTARMLETASTLDSAGAP